MSTEGNVTSSNVTVVSAFYLMKSKYPATDYFNWIRDFLEKIECQLIFYTTADLIPQFKEMRQKNIMNDRTIFVDYPTEKFMAYIRYGYKFWEKQKLIDREKNIHSPELYVIWYQKKEFVMESIKTNPFNSTKFIWCDAGCFRCPNSLPQQINFGQERNIPDDKMLLLQYKPFEQEEINSTSPRKLEYANRIGGGVQAGSIEAWKKWYDIYDEQLQTYCKYGKFIGKDQIIMMEITLNNPDLVKNIDPLFPLDWFSLLFILSNPPLVSILIPLYNGIEYLEETLDSIRLQRYRNWEVLIGVNGWPENSDVYHQAQKLCEQKLKVVNPWSKKSLISKTQDSLENLKFEGTFKVFDFYDTKGKSATMNRLAVHASGEWISLLDADDIWTENKLEIQSKYFKTYDIIGSNYSYFGTITGFPGIPLGDISDFDFWKVNPLGNSCTMFHRKLLTENTWNVENSGLDDYELWLTFRYGRKDTKIWNCSEVLMKHRIYPQSSYNPSNSNKLPSFLQSMRAKLLQ